MKSCHCFQPAYFILIVLISVNYPGAANIAVPSAAKTIAEAMTKAQQGDTVIVGKGVYKEKILLNPGVALRSIEPHKAILDGQGRGVVVTMAGNSSIDGFVVRNGTVGILSSSAGNTITRCQVVNNIQTGIMCIGHLPVIEDNIIAYNKGSGIQGWDVRSTAAVITYNTIAYNENHGIALAGNSDIIVENCIIAFNAQFAVKLDPSTARVTLNNNNIFRNATITQTLPAGNISEDPVFTNPQRFDFSLGSNSPCIGLGNDKKNLGAVIFKANGNQSPDK